MSATWVLILFFASPNRLGATTAVIPEFPSQPACERAYEYSMNGREMILLDHVCVPGPDKFLLR
jgi:hypothetical protein